MYTSYGNHIDLAANVKGTTKIYINWESTLTIHWRIVLGFSVFIRSLCVFIRSVAYS